jgi:hypothetical protein
MPRTIANKFMDKPDTAIDESLTRLGQVFREGQALMYVGVVTALASENAEQAACSSPLHSSNSNLKN